MKITKEDGLTEEEVPLPSTQVNEESGIEILGQLFRNLADVCFSISNFTKGAHNDQR